MFVSAKIHFLGTNPPTQIQKVCQRHLSKQTATCTKCKQPKQSVHADRSQEIQQPQTNANKTFSSQRLECLATSLLHHGPENRIQKTSRNMAAIKGPRLYTPILRYSALLRYSVLQGRPAHAKPDFNGLSGPRNGT